MPVEPELAVVRSIAAPPDRVAALFGAFYEARLDGLVAASRAG